jgi:hypothetical protein
MSHFTRLHTRMVQRDFLAAALRDLGYVVEVGNVEARGFNGISTRCELKVATRHKGYDIGFRMGPDGAYELVADWYGIPDVKPQELLTQIHRRYAYHAARAKFAEQGFSLVEEQQAADGQVRLVLRRAV